MKKLLLIITSIVVLSGCTASSVSIKDPEQMILKIGTSTITKSQIYDMMYAASGANQIINDAINFITDAEIEVTDAMLEQAQSTITLQKAIYQDQFEMLLTNNGFKDEQDYIDKTILPQLKLEALLAKYITENQETMFATYKPRKVQVMAFTDETIANEAFAAVSAGTDFSSVATEKKSTIDASEKIATTKSEYPLAVKLFIENATEPAVSELILDEESKTYYITKVTNTDTTTFTEDAAKSIASVQEVGEAALTKYIRDYELNVYVSDLYNLIKESYPDYLN